MTPNSLKLRLREVCGEELPLPGSGATAQRHRRLMQVARENVSLARLAEAHWDAVAILAEAGRIPEAGALYGVWASEMPGQPLLLGRSGSAYSVSGTKMFCSGAGVVDRALVTVGAPESRLLDLDLRQAAEFFEYDTSAWKTAAFQHTQTATASFHTFPLLESSFIGEPGWYLERPGFWHGACGPAACWAGGAAGLFDYGILSSRNDPHTRAHLAAMYANVWAFGSCLETAADEIDRFPFDQHAAQKRALALRHIIEQLCIDTLQRFSRAYGPAPLCMNEDTVLRYQETELYLRQSHAERDLESLGSCLRECLRL